MPHAAQPAILDTTSLATDIGVAPNASRFPTSRWRCSTRWHDSQSAEDGCEHRDHPVETLEGGKLVLDGPENHRRHIGIDTGDRPPRFGGGPQRIPGRVKA